MKKTKTTNASYVDVQESAINVNVTNKFKLSKKLTVAILGVVFLALQDYVGLNLPTETQAAIVAMVVGYLASQGFVDSKRSTP